MLRDLDPESPAPRARLRVAFSDAETFRREFESNLSQGGIFVPTERGFELRELVDVEIALLFCSESMLLPAEVVVWRSANLVAGVEAGVALQILEAASELRERFRRFVFPAPSRPIASPQGAERRKTPRVQSEVGARLQGEGERSTGRTRDLSTTGALLDVHGSAPSVGDEIQVTLVHPTHGEERRVTGRVIRSEEAPDAHTVVAVQFQTEDGERSQVKRFVEDVQAADHARRLGAIAGPVADLGVASLLQMFGMSAPRGTLLLTREGESGSISFEKGTLRSARHGGASGMKALGRLLAWRDGNFEFRSGFDAGEPEEDSLQLDAAILESMRQTDDLARCPSASWALGIRLKIVRPRLDEHASSLDKTEQAVVDLAGAGLSLGRLLDVIPETDAQIHGAVSSLFERGVLVPPR